MMIVFVNMFVLIKVVVDIVVGHNLRLKGMLVRFRGNWRFSDNETMTVWRGSGGLFLKRTR